MRWWAFIIVALLMSCQEIELIDTNQAPVVLSPDEEVRPDIPRSNPPQDTPYNYVEPDVPVVKPAPVPTPVGPAGTDLDVPLGDAIGEHHPLLTQQEFLLLKHSPVRVSQTELVGYDEFLRFDFGANSTGKVIFGRDEDNEDEIGTFLLFEEGRPILEYRLQLHRGTFEHYSGRTIQVLGHTYVIAEATNTSVSMYGTTVASNLFFDNGTKLVVNSTTMRNTAVKVMPSALSFIVSVDDSDGDFLLSPDERLSGNMPKLTFGTDLMDIRYKGAPQLDGASIELRKHEDGYDLIAQTIGGMVAIDLASLRNGSIMLGGDEPLHIARCASCIAVDDRFIVTSPDGRSYLLRYASLSGDKLIIRDEQNTRHYFEIRGNLSRDATADIIIDGHRFPVRIGQRDNATGEHNISVEQGFRNNRVELVLANGALLRIGTPNATVLPLQIVVPAAKTIDRREHMLPVNIAYDGEWHAVVGNVTFIEDEETEDAFGVTAYGTLIHLEREDEDLPLNTGDDVTILVPVEPLYGVVMIED